MSLTHPRPPVTVQRQMIPGPQGMEVYTECVGESHQPTLLLTHGGLQASRCFRKQVLALSLDFQVVLWDLPYHGRSGPPEEASMPAPITAHLWAEAMHSVVQAYHLDDTGFVQVAWSFGGLVTRNYLLTYGSQGLLGLVLVASHLDFVPLSQHPQMQAVQRQLEPLWQQAPGADASSLSALLGWHTLLFASRPEPEDDYETLGYNTLAWIRLGQQGARLLEAQLPADTAALLESLPFPVLLIHGARDALIPLAVAKTLSAAIPGAHLSIYEQCGHSPFLEDPNRFNQEVADFVHHLNASRLLR